jgi:hypothetical protein
MITKRIEAEEFNGSMWWKGVVGEDGGYWVLRRWFVE